MAEKTGKKQRPSVEIQALTYICYAERDNPTDKSRCTNETDAFRSIISQSSFKAYECPRSSSEVTFVGGKIRTAYEVICQPKKETTPVIVTGHNDDEQSSQTIFIKVAGGLSLHRSQPSKPKVHIFTPGWGSYGLYTTIGPKLRAGAAAVFPKNYLAVATSSKDHVVFVGNAVETK
jgi:hypothetical protein